MRIIVLSLGLLFAVVVTTRAEEKPIEASALPKSVADAVKAKFPKGEVTKAVKEEEEETTVFEVVVKVERKTVEVEVSEKGAILEIERAVPIDKLPQPVAEAIAAKYPEAKIKEAVHVVAFDAEEGEDRGEKDDDQEEEDEGDEEESHESKFFEITLASEGKREIEVKVAPNGKFLEDEDDEEEDGGQEESDG